MYWKGHYYSKCYLQRIVLDDQNIGSKQNSNSLASEEDVLDSEEEEVLPLKESYYWQKGFLEANPLHYYSHNERTSSTLNGIFL